jgi:hypothetical protein
MMLPASLTDVSLGPQLLSNRVFNMSHVKSGMLVAGGVLALLAVPAAAFTPISAPTPAYVSGTTLLGVPEEDESYSSWEDSALTISFSTSVTGLATDNIAFQDTGFTEGVLQPVVFWTGYDTPSITLSFSSPLKTFGFELGTEVGDFQDYTVQFFNGATLLGTISKYFEGDREFRLFAATAGPGQSITHVTATADWHLLMGRLRYDLAPSGGVIPEPATWAMLIAGFGLAGVGLRRRRPALA